MRAAGNLLDTPMGEIAKDTWKIEEIITKFDDHWDCQTLFFLPQKPGHQ